MTKRCYKAMLIVRTPFSLFAFAVLLASAKGYAGEFTVGDWYCDSSTDEHYCTIDYKYSGAIQSKDVAQFRTILKKTERHGSSDVLIYRTLSLSSNGGDVEAALNFARLIRSHQIQTQVWAEPCYSSCVIVFAGGVKRAAIFFAGAGPSIGIHRPYTETDANYIEHRAWFNTLQSQIRAFLREGGVSEMLWDDMIQIPPEKMKILSQQEVEAYGLNGYDPAYEDYLDGQKAKLYGLTRREYLKRRDLVEERCTPEYDPDILSGKKLQKCKHDIYFRRAN